MSALNKLKEKVVLYWIARTEQERKFLGVGGAVVALALVYAVAIAPALEGREKLRKDLPVLRQEAAQLQALALEASELARQAPPQVTPMTRESLGASLSARGLKPESLSMTGDYARLQLNGVSFANLYTWLDAQRRENRISVWEAAVTAATPAGQVDATLTLRQNTPQAGSGAR